MLREEVLQNFKCCRTLFLILLLLDFILATDIYVATNGTDSESCGNITSPCATPTQAADNAQNSDTIIISPGTYEITQTIYIGVPNLTIKAEVNNTVILFSNNCTTVFVNQFFSSVTLIGINFTESTYLPIILAYNSISFYQCFFQENHLVNISSLSVIQVISRGTVIFDNTQVIGNTISINNLLNTLKGPYIYVDCAEIIMNNFIFSNNLFQNSNTRDSFNIYGAFLLLDSDSLEMTNSLFSNNNFSIQNGVHLTGGIMQINSRNSNMLNCSFEGNIFDSNTTFNSGMLSGAAVSMNKEMNATLTNISFTNNVFKFCGGNIYGGIFYSPTNTYADTLIFINNTIEYTPSGNLINGGLAVFGQYYSLHNAQFIDNHIYPKSLEINIYTSCLTESVQGALVQAIVDVFDNLIVSNNSFSMFSSEYCYVGQVTGLFHMAQTENSFTLTNATFNNNTINGGSGISGSNVEGGCFVLEAKENIMENCTFSNNAIIAGNASMPLLYGSGAAGSAIGGVIAAKSSLSLTNCSFYENSAIAGFPVDCNFIITSFPVSEIPGSALGGAIYMEDTSPLTIRDCSFYGNEAISAGIESCRPSNSINDYTPCLGGTIYSRILDIENTVIEKSFCDFCKGGAIFSSNLTMSNTNITSNYVSAGFGGAIYLIHLQNNHDQPNDTAYLTVSLENVYLNNNTVEFGYGGVFYIDGINEMNFSSVVLAGNYASYGGGIYYQTFPGILTYNSFSIVDNQAQTAGGAIFIEYFDSFESVRGSPQINGDLMYLPPSSTFSPSQFATELVNNTASLYGEDCASSIYTLSFIISPPSHVWPGEKFVTVLALFDIYGNTVITSDYEVTVSASVPSKFSSGVPQDTVNVEKNKGYYDFPSSLLLSIPGEVIELYYNASYETFSFNLNASIQTSSCAPGFAYSNSFCYLCDSLEFNFDGEECVSCPHEEGGLPEECMVPLPSLVSEHCETDNPLCHLSECREYHLTDGECSDLIRGDLSLLEVPKGFWLIPTENQFLNPTSLIQCEQCQAFICILKWLGNDTSLATDYDWDVNCTIIVANSEEPSEEGSDECPFNPIDERCCLGYSNRLCSECVSGYYAKEEECKECSTEWYSSFWMIIVEIIVFIIVLLFALLFRKNLIALCAEIVVVVFLYLLGVGTLWFVLVLILIFSVIFLTNSDVREGILKSFIFYIQTCGLLLSSLFDWDSTVLSRNIDAISRNGVECYFGWFNNIVGFWFMMLLPIGILFFCWAIWLVGYKFHQSVSTLPKSPSQKKIKTGDRNSREINSNHEHEHDHKISSAKKWDCMWVKICLFLWYVIYYEVSARVRFFFLNNIFNFP